jgi:hypothetical protein
MNWGQFGRDSDAISSTMPTAAKVLPSGIAIGLESA